MNSRNTLETVALSLVNNGVHRDVIKNTIEAVALAELNEAVERATYRARNRRLNMIQSMQESVAYAIRERDNDHRTNVNYNERINEDNEIVSLEVFQGDDHYKYGI